MPNENKGIKISPRLGDSYSDVTIIFSDPGRFITMRLHRVFLAWLVPYFDKLFLFSENLKKEEFNIPVEDAGVAEVFIKSLYCQPSEGNSQFLDQEDDFFSDCYNFLHLCKLRSYFCLDIDPEQLYEIKVPAETFDLFLQVVNLPEIEINLRLIRAIRRNLPAGYKWEGVNEEFKREVARVEKYIISGRGGGDIIMWDLDLISGKGLVSKDCIKSLTDHIGLVGSIVVRKDHHQIISGSYDRTIKIWEIVTGKCVKTLIGHTGWVMSTVMTGDQQKIISGSQDGTIKIWDIASGECDKTIVGHTGWVMSMIITEDQQQIISGSQDETIKIWNIASGECVKTLTGHSGRVTSIVITGDQQQIVSGSSDRTIKIWNVASGECVKTLTGHSRRVTSIVMMGDQQKIISGSRDGTIKIWNVASGECVKTLPAYRSGVTSMVITGDQQQIVSANQFGNLKIWDIAAGECVETLSLTDDNNNIILSLALF